MQGSVAEKSTVNERPYRRLLARISDWKFFLDNEDWLNKWARRFGESAVQALAEELRRTNWRRLE